jgi:uncharacterized protein (TIGR03437 family)
MRTVFVSLALSLLGVALDAQPLLYARSVVNAASYVPAGLPSGSIARGSIFTVFGTGIGPPPPGRQVSEFPIATTLANVSISVTQGATTVAALPLYVSATQINALMPSNTPLGTVSLRVTFNNSQSNPLPVQIVNASFGIFSFAGGFGPGVFQNFIASDKQPFNTPQTPAKPGQVVTLYGTGLGPVAADNVAPPAATLSTQVDLTVGGQSAKVLYSGRSPCCSGLDQIVFQVPDNAPLGCWIPVYMRTAGTFLSNAVTISISSDGSACTADPVSTVLSRGGNAAVLTLVRTSTHQDVGVSSTTDVIGDHFVFDMAQHKGGSTAFDFFPPAGTCTVYQTSGDWLGTGRLPALSNPIKLLDAGTFSITGPKGSKSGNPPDAGAQAAILGTSWSAPGFQNLLYLDPGAYQISASGGADVKAFQVNVTVPTPFTWTNRDQLATVDRTQPLTVSWSGAGSQTLAVEGAVTDSPSNSSAVFVCVGASGATSITVPPTVLAALPASRPLKNQTKAALYLATVPFANGTTFSASGLDAGIASAVYNFGRTITVK